MLQYKFQPLNVLRPKNSRMNVDVIELYIYELCRSVNVERMYVTGSNHEKMPVKKANIITKIFFIFIVDLVVGLRTPV